MQSFQVIRISDLKMDAALGGDLFGAHGGVKMISAPGLDGDEYEGHGQLQIKSTREIQPNRAGSIGAGFGVKIHKRTTDRPPAPIEAAIDEISAEISVPNQ